MEMKTDPTGPSESKSFTMHQSICKICPRIILRDARIRLPGFKNQFFTKCRSCHFVSKMRSLPNKKNLKFDFLHWNVFIQSEAEC